MSCQKKFSLVFCIVTILFFLTRIRKIRILYNSEVILGEIVLQLFYLYSNQAVAMQSLFATNRIHLD